MSRERTFLCALVAMGLCGVVRGENELVRAFAFGATALSCESPNSPGTNYTIVLQGSADELEYDASRGWGYEVVNPGDTGYGRFGPFDDSANFRDVFADTCPSELYDSFIGAKNFSTPCTGVDPCSPPEGIVFRIDVPNGTYRFVGAVGSADNPHTSRIVVEDGGSGGPTNLGANNVVLVHNFDQGLYDPGVFARVGFDGFLPPEGGGVGFVDMDANGMEAGAADSPTLEVTQGYLRVHQLQGATSGADPNGGNMVILELWRDENTFRPIERGSSWKLLPGTAEASSPVAAWREIGFDDSSWLDATAPIGYGEAGIVTDISLLNPPMRNNYTSIFLRQTFELSNPAGVNQFEANVDYDDGLVAWINGVEVLRLNVDGLDGDPVAFDELTPAGHESGLFEGYPLPDPSGYLLAGTNVVAVQVFNTSITSSDLKLDLEIFDPVAPDLSPPSVDMVVPSPGVTVRSLTSIQVTFDEEVAGVDAADLLIDGVPAASVSGSARGPYVFTFAEPAVGSVSVQWSPVSGITDQASPPNLFSGGSWIYNLNPDAPPGNVVINELLAVNGSGLSDQDGDTSDWFELLNAGTEAVDLGGWSVTDDPDLPGKFVLPSRVLDPQRFLVIFASGKNRRPASGELHANYRLSSGGEYLALFNNESPRELISVFAPRYPRQRSDYSYGLDGTGDLVYFSSPTPGAPNTGGTAFDGFVLEPRFTPERGLYDEPFSATITSVTPGSTIRYTLDGSEPSPTRGTVYTSPISVAPTATRAVTTVRAIAYASNLLPSQVVTHSYIFTEDVRTQPANPPGFPTSWNGQPADYEMDSRVVNDPGHRELVRQGLVSIPTMSIVMDLDDLFGGTRGFYANPSRSGIAWERACSAELIYPDGREGFQVDCGIRAQGGSSVSGWKVIKISMRLAFRGDYGPTRLRYPLFPDSPVQDFNTLILDAHMNQTWQHPSHSQRVRGDYIRDVFMSDVQNAMGGFGPHDVYVNLYLNGLYWGVFDVHERADSDFGASYFGGDPDEYDALKHNGSQVEDGNSNAWNAMISVANRDLSSSANYLALRDHIDMPRFVDYIMMNLFGGNDDWDHHNWYATRRRTGGPGLWRFHSWDAEHSLKSTTIDETGKNNSGQPTGIFQRLRSNADFRLLFADRVHRHFFGDGICHVDPSNPTWDEESPQRNRPADLFMKRVREIDTAIACEAARWGDTRRPAEPYTRNDEWQTEINWLIRQYFEVRSFNVLEDFENAGLYPLVGAPVFNRVSGRVPPGFALTMTRPAGTSGTIYYTTDGTDPRVFGSGAISGSAQAYSSPITIDDFTLLKARVWSGSTWSALNESRYGIGAPGVGLRISEIMYNPLTSAAFEFVELVNTDSQTAGLGGLRFTAGLTFAFASDQLLAPGERLVLVSDATAFASRYPGVEIGGVFLGTLDNGGERITLETTDGETITSFEYDDDEFWPRSPDGLGFSLVRADLEGDADDPTSWRASANLHGSPGDADPRPIHGGVIINEVLAHSQDPLEDAIELFNWNSSAIDIGGWYLSDRRDSEANLRKYRIPDGTVLPAGGFAVFYEVDFGSGPLAFHLSAEGGEVFLASFNGAGALTGHVVGAEYGPEESGVAFGTYATATGLVFTALAERSFGVDLPSSVQEFRTGGGAENHGALVGPLVINEIMYNPAENREEFVELYNPTTQAIPLYDSQLGRGWRVQGLLDPFGLDDWEFGPGDEVPARGFLVLVGIDAGLFRALNAVPASEPVVGPFGGRLNNTGERLKLLKPAQVEGRFAFISMDEVRYDESDPWPVAADGSGRSLERIVAISFGDNAVNWSASTRFGGTPGAPNTSAGSGENLPPRAAFTASPASGEEPLEVFFNAGSSYDLDGAIVRYSWDFDDAGATAEGRTAVHTFLSQGVYIAQLTVEDDEGETDTETLLVTVRVDPGGGQIPGDGNQDGLLEIGDGVTLLLLLFRGDEVSLPCAGDALETGSNRILLDLNNDTTVDMSDVVYMLAYLFRNGTPPSLGTECLPIPGCPDVCAP